LSGDGGDESFAGYDFRYVPHAMEAAARRWLPGIRGLAGWLAPRWPRSTKLPKPLRIGTLLDNLGHDPAAAYYADLAFLKPAETRRLMGQAPDPAPETSPIYQSVTEPYRRCPSADAVQRAEYADLKVYLPNDPLVKVDRMSMAHGLEVRCPLLDHRVVELAFRIPAAQKLRWRQSKVLLRALARQRLPARIWELPKRGFTVPIGAWIAGPHRGMFEDEVLGKDAALSTYVDARELGRRFDLHCRGERDESYALWAVWVLERWLKRDRSSSRVTSFYFD
jgi:asparagine synthase (glutamine-hydrolysing)